MTLREIAHSRTGDKGDFVTISIIAYDSADFPLLESEVTTERVNALFKEFIAASSVRYSLPNLSALIFVLKRPANQGVTRSLALDAHGKCLGSAMLGMKIQHVEGVAKGE